MAALASPFRRLGRWLRWVSAGVACLLGLVAVLVALAFTPPVQELLRPRLVKAINEQILGRVELAHLRLRPSGRLQVEGMTLIDPQSRPVIRLGQLEIDVDLGQLLRHRVELTRVSLSSPTITWLAAPDGSTLQEALSPRKPLPPAPQTSAPTQSAWTFSLDQLDIADGSLTFHSALPNPRSAEILGFAMHGQAEYGPGSLRVTMSGDGSLTSPLAAPMHFELSASGSSLPPQGVLTLNDLRVEIGDSELLLNGVNQGGAIDAALRATLSPTLGRTFGAELAGPLRVDGSGSWDGRLGELEVRTPADQGAVRLRASVDQRSAHTAIWARLRWSELDASRWISTAPSTDLQGELETQADLSPLSAPRFQVSLLEGRGTVNQIDVERVYALARVEGSAIHVHRLAVLGAGGEASLSGTANPQTVDLALTGHLPNLAAAARAARVTGWRGAVDLGAHVSGPLRQPAVALNLRAPALLGPGLSVRNLRLEGTAVPLAARPRIDATLGVGSGVIQGFPIHQLSARVRTDDQGIFAHVETPRPDEPHLDVVGTYVGTQAIRLQRLTLGLRNEEWTMASPSTIRWKPVVHLEPLVLTSGEERIEARGDYGFGKLDAALIVSGFRLDGLPATLFPRYGLGGRVWLKAVASGSTSSPDLGVDLRVRGLKALTTYQARAIDLQAHLARWRLQGHLLADTWAGHAEARVDAPVRSLTSQALSAHLRGNVDLRQLAPLLHASADDTDVPQGQIELAADLSGSLAHPVADIRTDLQQVSAAGAPPTSGSLELHQRDRATHFKATLRTHHVTLDADAQATLPARWTRRRDLPQRLKEAPFDVSLATHGLALEHWRHFLGLPSDAKGSVDVDARVQGPILDARGSIRVATTPVTFAGYQLGSSKMEISADGQAIQTHLEVTDSTGEKALALQGRVEAGLRSLTHGADLRRVPLNVTSHGNIQIERFRPSSPVHGSVELDMEAQGELGDPRAKLSVRTPSLDLGGRPLPAAELEADYRNRLAQAHIVVPHMRLDATARTALGVGVPPPSPRHVPVEVILAADHFDLSAYAGITEDLETLGGSLNGQLTARGEMEAPQVEGELELDKGRLILAGTGDFENVGMKLAASPDRISVPYFDIQSGKGKFHADGKAVRQGDGSFAVNAEVSADRFPLLYQDQLMALLQMSSQIDGHLQRGDSLLTVHFKNIHLDVPSLTHKDIEKLQPNPDVVLVHSLQSTGVLSARTPANSPGRAHPKPSSRSTIQGPRSEPPLIRVALLAPSDFWIRGSDLNVDLRAAMGLQLRNGLEVIDPPGSHDPSYAEVVRGHVDVLGRRFDIPEDKPARVTFGGGDITNGTLDVHAVYKDSADNVTVNVAVTGPLEHPHAPTLTSDPPLDSSALAFLLATGHLQAKRGSSGISTAQAASVLGSLIASQAQSILSKHLPLDTLTIQSSDQGVTIQAGVYLTAISDRLYLAYAHNVITGTETDIVNQNELQMQYQLSKRWELDAYGGDAGKGGAGAMWTRDY